jgi:iron(III) transport system substrate-binding protein
MRNAIRREPWCRHLAVLAVCLATTGTSFAQSSADKEWTATVAAAKKEGRVMLYNSAAQPIGERLAAAFRKTYPEITIEVFRAVSGQIIPRLEQERKTGAEGGDVIINSDIPYFKGRIAEGALLPPSPETARRWPKRFVLYGGVYIGGLEPLVVIYNKNLVKTPPKSFADLLAPEYRGRIGTSTLAATSVVAFYDWAERTLGADYLTLLRAQNPKLYNGGTPMSQAVASGEVAAAGIAAVPANARTLMGAGAPIDYVVPSPGIGIFYGIAALVWSKRPNAARVLADFVLSPQGQAAWHGAGESASPLPGIPGSLDASTISLWDPEAFPADVVNTYTTRFNAIFK